MIRLILDYIEYIRNAPKTFEEREIRAKAYNQARKNRPTTLSPEKEEMINEARKFNKKSLQERAQMISQRAEAIPQTLEKIDDKPSSTLHVLEFTKVISDEARYT